MDRACARAGYGDWKGFEAAARKVPMTVIARSLGVRLKRGQDGNHQGLCPFHEDRHPSFSVHDERGWVCLASSCGRRGRNGPAMLLEAGVAATWTEALLEAAARAGLAVPSIGRAPAKGKRSPPPPARPTTDAAKKESGPPRGWPDLKAWPVVPPPADIPIPAAGLAFTVWRPRDGAKPDASRRAWDCVHEYRDASGRLLGLTLRREASAGYRKAVLPCTWRARDPAVPRNGRWVMAGWPIDTPRPVYGMDALLDRRRRDVLVVEGEKTRDAAAAVFPGMLVIAPMGGCNGAARGDWLGLLEWMKEAGPGVRVVVWPDADRPVAGRPDPVAASIEKVADALAGSAEACGLSRDCMRVYAVDPAAGPPPGDLKAGWDLADLPDDPKWLAWAAARVKAALVVRRDGPINVAIG